MAVTGTGTAVLNFTASGDAVTDLCVPDSCRWIGATAAGDTCTVKTIDGNLIFKSKADGPNFVDGWVFPPHFLANGIDMASLSSGEFQMYLGSK